MAGNMQDGFDENGNPIRCSFCGKEQGQVRRLVKGPTNIFICDECVAACSEILEESLASDFMDAARNGKLPGFLNDHGQAASQPAVDPEAEGFELEDDARQVITHVPTPHEIYDELSAYVMGQEDAKRAMSVAVYNHYRRVIEDGAALSAFDEADGMGGQFDDDMDEVELAKSNILLLGPTGTGKTEIVKAITELLFGDERSMLRFDMSEYGAENSDQKLFGAPPGYVGYAEGGQLTNAVKANPFSVVLFDEIEKAAPSIMDKFLQILEDGRLTDGQGNTVYFSETVIFFTSNIGFSKIEIDAQGNEVRNTIAPNTPYDEICERVRTEMDREFKPEFLGRIGDNVVIFNFIDDAVALQILNSKIDAVNRNVHKAQPDITVEATDAARELLHSIAMTDAVKAKGGRGIGNLVESGYLNGLSDFLFEHRAEWRGRPGMVARAVPQGEGDDAHIAFELVPGSMGGDWR